MRRICCNAESTLLFHKAKVCEIISVAVFLGMCESDCLPKPPPLMLKLLKMSLINVCQCVVSDTLNNIFLPVLSCFHPGRKKMKLC